MTYLNRRQALGGFAVTFELLATGAFADAVVAKRKLVVVICRGGLDGLSLSPPVGDPDYAGLRGPIATLIFLFANSTAKNRLPAPPT